MMAMPKQTTIKQKPLDRQRIEEMIEDAGKHGFGSSDPEKALRNKALIEFMWRTGARVTEILKTTPEDFEDHGDLIVCNIPTLKKKVGVYRRKIPVQKGDIPHVLEYLAGKQADEPLFKISRKHAWNIVKRANSEAWPHLFRHTRLSELAAKGASDQQLTQYAGWTDSRPAKHYVYLRWQDLLEFV